MTSIVLGMVSLVALIFSWSAASNLDEPDLNAMHREGAWMILCGFLALILAYVAGALQ